MRREDVYRVVEKSGNLPVLPEALVRLLSACEKEDTPVSEIADIISTDPVLSAKVLKLVNSAYYGCRHSFSSITQAVIYLGANTVKNLALTLTVQQVLGTQLKNKTGLDSVAFWHNSLLCASLAGQLAEKTNSASREDAYLAGLLLNIGKLVLSVTFPEKYSELTDSATTDSEIAVREVGAFGIHHGELGAWMVGKWHLSSLLADAILYHHDSPGRVGEAFPLVKIAYTANELAEARSDDNFTKGSYRDFFHLESVDIEQLLDNSREEVDEIAAVLGLTPGGKSASRTGGEDAVDRLMQNAVGTLLVDRVENVSLLSAFLEELLQAEGLPGMLRSFERAVTLYFEAEQVLFFFPDDKNIFLQVHTSGQNPLRESCRGLSLPILTSSSYVVKCFQEKNRTETLVEYQDFKSLADRQVLSVLQCPSALVFGLRAKGQSVGVGVIAFSQKDLSFAKKEMALLKTLSRQLAASLLFERQRQLRSRDLYQERMQAISLAAGKFSHEINNPLGIIGNYLMAMKLKLSSNPEVQNDLVIVDEEIRRISNLVGQMGMFSQTPFTKFEDVDLNLLIKKAVKLMETSLFARKDLQISFIPGSGLGTVLTSADAVKQVLINLLKNAAEALAEGGRVIVRTTKGGLEGDGEEGGVEIIVSDTGPGLPEKVKENLFSPFVTTKAGGHSGLGLSIVHKTVAEIGGKIACTSTQTEGTTFRVSLPRIVPVELRGAGV